VTRYCNTPRRRPVPFLLTPISVVRDKFFGCYPLPGFLFAPHLSSYSVFLFPFFVLSWRAVQAGFHRFTFGDGDHYPMQHPHRHLQIPPAAFCGGLAVGVRRRSPAPELRFASSPWSVPTRCFLILSRSFSLTLDARPSHLTFSRYEPQQALRCGTSPSPRSDPMRADSEVFPAVVRIYRGPPLPPW